MPMVNFLDTDQYTFWPEDRRSIGYCRRSRTVVTRSAPVGGASPLACRGIGRRAPHR